MFYFSITASGGSIWEKIAVWYQNSVIHEILTFLEERYFSVEFQGYENINLGASANQTAQTLILALMIGIILAAAASAFTRTKNNRIVRALLDQQIHTPAEGKTLMELGFFRSSYLRHELSRGVHLRRVIRCREEEEYNATEAETTAGGGGEDVTENGLQNAENRTTSFKKPYRMDFLTAHFYIPEDLRYRAEIRYTTKGSGWLMFLITLVATVVFAALACRFLPDLMRLVDGIISMTAPN